MVDANNNYIVKSEQDQSHQQSFSFDKNDKTQNANNEHNITLHKENRLNYDKKVKVPATGQYKYSQMLEEYSKRKIMSKKSSISSNKNKKGNSTKR